MANTFVKQTRVTASQMIGLLQREIKLPALTWRLGLSDFRYAANDTVTVKIPPRLTATARAVRATSAISATALTEDSVSVVLDKGPYVAVEITAAEWTLDIDDYAMQVAVPEARAIAEYLEDVIGDALGAATYAETIEWNTGDPHATAVDCRKLLNDANVPAGDRFLVVGSELEATLLKDDLFRRVDGSSGATSALQESTLGRIAGFTVVQSNALDPHEGYAMHRSAVAFANVAPAVPPDTVWAEAASSNGLALTHLRQWNPTYLRYEDVSHSFAGVKVVNDGEGDEVVRAVKIVDSLTS